MVGNLVVDAKVKINGEAYTCKLKQGHFAEIKRKWGNNDVITLDMPMNWRFIRGTMAQYNRAALMRGPVVYCLSNKQNQGLLDAENHHEKIIICPNDGNNLCLFKKRRTKER